MDMLSPFSFPFLVIIRGQDPERDLCKIMLIKQRDPADRDRIPGRKGMAPYQRWKLAMNLEGLHCRCHGVRQKQGISALGCWLPRHRGGGVLSSVCELPCSASSEVMEYDTTCCVLRGQFRFSESRRPQNTNVHSTQV
jgi:hypothetical protein